MPENSLIPEKYHILSGSALKVIAVTAMILDHIATVFLSPNAAPILRILGHTLTSYSLLRLIGRIAFPIFAFLLVEGFYYTRDRRKYGVRLFLFAVISEIPWNLAFFGNVFYLSAQNVFFTLFLGYLALCVIDHLKNSEDPGIKIRDAVFLVGLFAVSLVFRADYGCAGFGFILMMYFLRSEPLFRAVLSGCMLSSRWKAGLSAIPISLYNGKRGFIHGRAMKIAFYAIYPVHLLILFVIHGYLLV